MASMSRARVDTGVVSAFRRTVEDGTVAGFGAALQAVSNAIREAVAYLVGAAVCFGG
jgi:hypothetical protein